MERSPRRCTPPPSAYPWLVYYHGRRLRNQTFCTISDPGNNCVRSLPELRKRYVWNCCHGWVILSDDAEDQFHLWNPVTSESVRLPRLQLNSKSRINDCILSSRPGDHRSTILLFDRGVQSVWFCCLGDKQWIQKRYNMEIKRLSGEDNGDYLREPVCCGGKLYATTRGGQLVLIEPIKPNGLVITPLRNQLPSANVQLGPRVRTDLVESRGELFCIEVQYAEKNHPEAITVEIFRLDFSSMVWNRVDSVKDRVFFLDSRSSYSCSASYCSETEGNRVYFILSEDKSLYSYNIEDGSILVSLPCQNLPTPWEEPIWLMPDIRSWLKYDVGSDALINAPKEEGSKKRGAIQEEERDSEGTIEVGEEEEEEKNTGNRESDGTHFVDLPLDILKSLVDRLILVDYMNFRALCITCRLVAPPIKWRTAMSGSVCYSLTPWMVTIERKGICSLVDPKHGNKYFVHIPEPLQDAILCVCKDGWLMMCKYEQVDQLCIFFFNPFTKEIIQYPDLLYVGLDFSRFCFSSAPTSSNCVVVMVTILLSYVDVFVCRSREGGWHSFSLETDSCLGLSYNVPISINSSFYFLGPNGEIGILRFEDEDNCIWEVKTIQKPCKSFNHNFLTECNGELMSVFVGTLGKGLKVFKLNTSTMVWDRVKSLGNHTLYISRSSVLSTVENTPEMTDRIYFSRFRGQQHLVSYSLSSCEYQSSTNKDSFHDFYDTREPLMCGWIEPMWS